MVFRKLSAIALILAFVASIAIPDALAAQVSREYKIKAVYMLKFLTLVEWPDNAFTHATAPMVVGILGKDPFGEALEKTFEGKTVGRRELLIKRSYSLDELKNAHLLFICSSEMGNISNILGPLKGSSVLTVSETDEFIGKGGIVNFKIVENRTRYEVNNRAAEKAGLKFDPQLLERAVSVE